MDSVMAARPASSLVSMDVLPPGVDARRINLIPQQLLFFGASKAGRKKDPFYAKRKGTRKPRSARPMTEKQKQRLKQKMSELNRDS